VQHRTIERESSLTESPPPGFPTGWGRNCATRNFGDPGANSLAVRRIVAPKFTAKET